MTGLKKRQAYLKSLKEYITSWNNYEIMPKPEIMRDLLVKTGLDEKIVTSVGTRYSETFKTDTNMTIYTIDEKSDGVYIKAGSSWDIKGEAANAFLELSVDDWSCNNFRQMGYIYATHGVMKDLVAEKENAVSPEFKFMDYVKAYAKAHYKLPNQAFNPKDCCGSFDTVAAWANRVLGWFVSPVAVPGALIETANFENKWFGTPKLQSIKNELKKFR
ncbi:hypothetical protein FACS189421_11960 [Bacteroidia bacterium]|nr:hypothetical protein FACS189421_11960 [Bacteroidia bacterium]